MTINNGALNTADFNTATYNLTQLLIPRDKNPLYGTLYNQALIEFKVSFELDELLLQCIVYHKFSKNQASLFIWLSLTNSKIISPIKNTACAAFKGGCDFMPY